MNYADLQTAIIDDSHRPDLAAKIPRFIRECEGMIRRDLTALILTTTLTESDRSLTNPPQYSLPVRSLMIRRLALQGSLGGHIERISLGSINSYDVTQRVAVYVEPGDGMIEFRGSPAENAIFDLNYFSVPARLVEPADTNDLLEDNETLYKAGSMYYVYQHTQDRELAADQLNVFNGIIASLNEEFSRKIGGAKITASYQYGGGRGD